MDYARKGLEVMPEVLIAPYYERARNWTWALPDGGIACRIGETTLPAPATAQQIRAAEDAERTETLKDTLKKVSVGLIVLGAVTGAAMALGSGAVNKWVWRK